MREPPPGTKQGNAHDVAREAGIISALADSGVPVPRVIGVGATRSGGSFFVMERVPGAPLESEADARVLDPQQRHHLGVEVITTLASLHRLDPATAGLTVPDTSYVQRQIRRVGDAWLRLGSGSAHDSAWRAVCARLLERVPDGTAPAVVMHGDFRLSNLLVKDGDVTAVLDWELCTVGDPLADLAWLLDDWRSPGRPRDLNAAARRARGDSRRGRN